MAIHFFYEDVDFVLEGHQHIEKWLLKIIEENSLTLSSLNYIFCSDDYLLKINEQYLDHHDYTDIITFDHSEEKNEIEGDIFISIDRVKENAIDLKSNFSDELHRVLSHGLLHLIGYMDKTDLEKRVMREKENGCLSLLSNMGST